MARVSANPHQHNPHPGQHLPPKTRNEFLTDLTAQLSVFRDVESVKPWGAQVDDCEYSIFFPMGHEGDNGIQSRINTLRIKVLNNMLPKPFGCEVEMLRFRTLGATGTVVFQLRCSFAQDNPDLMQV